MAMKRTALFFTLAVLAIGCNQPKITVTPTNATIKADDTLVYAVDAVRWDLLHIEINEQPAATLKANDSNNWPVIFTTSTPGTYSLYWSAENLRGQNNLASAYTFVTVTD